MKNTFYILIALVLLMAACGRPSGNAPLSAELQRAEDLMYPHPDSALHILQAMTPPKDELNHATWALLLTQAKYKCFVDQSDSLVNIAHDYFMKGDDAQRKALVLYHKAVIYKEKNRAEESLTYFLKAAKEVEKTNDFQLAYLIYSHTGRLYVHRKLYDYSTLNFEKANKYAHLSSSPDYIVDSYNNMARNNTSQGRIEKAIEYYDKAIEIGKAFNVNVETNHSLMEKIGIYVRQKEYKKALNIAKQLNETPLTAPGYQVLGHLYSKIDQIDSAYFYLDKALQTNDIYVLRTTYQVLFNLSKKQKDYQKNAEYSVKLWKINDSINKIDRNKALIEMQEKYDQQRVRDEFTHKMRLKEQRIWTVVSISVVVLIAVALFLWIQIKRKNQERITRLAEAEERIETLNHLLEEAQKEPSPDAGEDDTFFKRILLQQLGIIRMVANTPTAQNQALLRRLAEAGNDEMPAEELIAWKDLYPIIDRLYNGFYTRLTQHFGSVLTDKEVQTCCLLCAGFSTKEIAVITRQAVNTVYIRKSSSRQKMGMPEGADIVEWVKNFSLKSV